MANKNFTMKQKVSETEFNILHPETVAEQVIESTDKRFTSDTELGGKVDKVTGKQLSTEDFTTELKTKLEAIDDTGTPTGLADVATSGDYNDLINSPTLGTASDKNVGTAEGEIPLLLVDGKLDVSVLPSLAITDVHEVNSEAAMLALDVQKGDIAVRSDVIKSYILSQEPASNLANWIYLPTPEGTILSVNGKTGVVELTKADVGLGNVTNESKATMFTSPQFTGTPTAPTPTVTDNSTQIATTEFVKTAIEAIPQTQGVQIITSQTEPTDLEVGGYWYEITN